MWLAPAAVLAQVLVSFSLEIIQCRLQLVHRRVCIEFFHLMRKTRKRSLVITATRFVEFIDRGSAFLDCLGRLPGAVGDLSGQARGPLDRLGESGIGRNLWTAKGGFDRFGLTFLDQRFITCLMPTENTSKNGGETAKERSTMTSEQGNQSQPTREEVRGVLVGLIDGTITRAQASDWAGPWVTRGGVHDELIWDMIDRIFLADQEDPTIDRYLYSPQTFRNWLDEFDAQVKHDK